MILQVHDPHRFVPDLNTFYYFLILGPVLVLVLLYVSWKVLSYFDNRKSNSRRKPKQVSDSEKKEGEPEWKKVRKRASPRASKA